MAETREFQNYNDFFDFYLTQHSQPLNRWLHGFGTIIGLAVALVAITFGHPWYVLLWPVIGYGFAWAGHFLVEKNKPATFGHPWWSFISDFRMLVLMATGKLETRLSAATSQRRS